MATDEPQTYIETDYIAYVVYFKTDFTYDIVYEKVDTCS